MRHAQHLAGRGQFLEPPPDAFGSAAADARIHFIEDQRAHGGGTGSREAGLERQRDARDLASRRHLLERPRLLAQVRRHQELHAVRARRRPCRIIHHHAEHGPLHRQLRQFRLDALLQLAGGRPARFAQLAGGLAVLPREPLLLLAQRLHALARRFDTRDLPAHVVVETPAPPRSSRRTCASACRSTPAGSRPLRGARDWPPGRRDNRAVRRPPPAC